MCYYDLTRFVCGCRAWSERRQACDEALRGESDCERKQVRKHIYDRAGGESCPTHINFYDHTQSSNTNDPTVRAPSHCPVANCFLHERHLGSHLSWTPCSTRGCSLAADHAGPHAVLLEDLRTIVARLEEVTRISEDESMRQLSLMVLSAMGISQVAPRVATQEQRLITEASPKSKSARNTKQRIITPSSSTASENKSFPYLRLNLSNQQIRLFELQPRNGTPDIKGSFHCAELATCPSYIALSYTWGDQTVKRKIHVDDGRTITVGENVGEFLRLQSSVITQPTLFWIDAICINQANVHERNHQVGLMKQIYTCAQEVFVWLGTEADNSDFAMDFLIQQTSKSLRTRGPGYHRVWSREAGKALHALCERQYWRRMWIIQEILHAERITVWCGSKSFDWSDVESLYLKLKKLEDTNWFAHHEFHLMVMQSSAATMIWQRAHWRHPNTPEPHLQQLIQIFRDWQCTDVRDKVFALVGMAAANSAIVPDYSLSTREVYFAVVATVDKDKSHFANLLSQVLGLSARDCDLRGQDLIEYKVQPAERLVLRSRHNDEWG